MLFEFTAQNLPASFHLFNKILHHNETSNCFEKALIMTFLHEAGVVAQISQDS
ncbi:MAG: hypothetical protein CLLPBCKN_007037 [Chroococcidiopsis cubana SAG 39.79]|nr:hypothetical protein [Chroococcidiopsis cubana SAG 39.79]